MLVTRDNQNPITATFTLAIVLKMSMVQFEVYSKVPISFKWTSKVKVLYTLKIALLYLRATMQVA